MLSCTVALLLSLCVSTVHAQSDGVHGSDAASQHVPSAGPISPVSPVPRYQLDPSGYELRKLRNERPSMFWPVSAIAVSGGVAVGIAAILGAAFAFDASYGDDGGPTRQDVREVRPLFLVAGGAALVAGAGVFWLVRTIHARRPYNQRMRELTTSARSPALFTW